MSSEINSAYICPITRGVMVKPVVAQPCGHVFDHVAIESWMREQGRMREQHLLNEHQGAVCPLDQREIRQLVPQEGLREEIHAFICAHPTLFENKTPETLTEEVRREFSELGATLENSVEEERVLRLMRRLFNPDRQQVAWIQTQEILWRGLEGALWRMVPEEIAAIEAMIEREEEAWTRQERFQAYLEALPHPNRLLTTEEKEQVRAILLPGAMPSYTARVARDVPYYLRSAAHMYLGCNGESGARYLELSGPSVDVSYESDYVRLTGKRVNVQQAGKHVVIHVQGLEQGCDFDAEIQIRQGLNVHEQGWGLFCEGLKGKWRVVRPKLIFGAAHVIAFGIGLGVPLATHAFVRYNNLKFY